MMLLHSWLAAGNKQVAVVALKYRGYHARSRQTVGHFWQSPLTCPYLKKYFAADAVES